MQVTLKLLKALESLDSHSFTAKVLKLMAKGEFPDLDQKVDLSGEVVVGELSLEEKALDLLGRRYARAEAKIGLKMRLLVGELDKTKVLAKLRKAKAHCHNGQLAAECHRDESIRNRLTSDKGTLAMAVNGKIVLIPKEQDGCNCPACSLRKQMEQGVDPLALLMGLTEGRTLGPFTARGFATFIESFGNGDGQEKKVETEKTPVPPASKRSRSVPVEGGPFMPSSSDNRTDLQARPFPEATAGAMGLATLAEMHTEDADGGDDQSDADAMS